MHKIADGVD